MKNLAKNFKNRTIDYDKLLEYGFIKNEDSYFYEKNICDNNFKVVVELSKDRQISKVIDLSINDEYILVDVDSSSGNFVGKVKEEYSNTLSNLIEECSILDIFKSTQAKQIIDYIKNKYGDNLEYLWENALNNAIWRNKENNKWYGLLVVLQEKKLGINSDRIIDIIDLRYQKDKIDEIIDCKKIFRGYHMNKNSWITIKLDGSVGIEEIYKLIDNSYNLSLKK